MIAYHLNIEKGYLFDGKYLVIEKIGGGSYGDVYKVSDSLNNVHALKLLRLWEVMSDLHDGIISRFEQEYNVMRISSEYLVHSIDFGVVQGNPYIVMELCQKGDLSHFAGKDASLLCNYAHDILEGLHALHRDGKVHRDLKPENVLIRNNGKAALTDFGVVGEMEKAKRMSEVGWWRQRPKQAFGTPLYMSPEIYFKTGGGVTYLPMVDIWSFGVMMFELLTGGSFPFGNIESVEDFPHYMERAKNGKWDKHLLQNVPNGAEWTYIIGKCLEPNPKNRYQGCVEIMQDMSPMTGSVNPSFLEERASRKPNITRLVISHGENVGTVFVLSQYLPAGGRMVHVGRETGNDIVLPESYTTYLSRYHFTMEKSADGAFWTIRDGQWQKSERRWVTSTNGTYLNATPVTPAGMKVFTGDIITAGEYKIKVE